MTDRRIEAAADAIGLALSPCQCRKLEKNEELWWRVRISEGEYLVVRAHIRREDKDGE